MRGATGVDQAADDPVHISIHAPHARGDVILVRISKSIREFQSTPLMRGATLGSRQAAVEDAISIHAPHARGDVHRDLRRRVLFISIHAPHARGDWVF